MMHYIDMWKTPSNCNTKLLNIINTQMNRRWWMSTRAEYEVVTEKWRSMALISSYNSDHMDRQHDDEPVTGIEVLGCKFRNDCHRNGGDFDGQNGSRHGGEPLALVKMAKTFARFCLSAS
eukprot:scaffold15943_cov78-Skeletonema_dohrnii-CCMP3373.AAC.2